MPSDDTYLRRAELLADLGRYEEAAEELGRALAADPADSDALAMLARIRLSGGKPVEALDAADQAIAAEPANLNAIVARGLALARLDRTAPAVEMAEELLRLGPEDAHAQMFAAAILGDVRNGQRALDAAWRSVQLAPEEPTAHLVLAMVANRLELFDLAERAYREALRLDPQLSAAQHDMGLMQVERRRYAEGLQHLIDAAATNPSDVEGGRSVNRALGQMLWTGAGYSFIAPVLVACGGDSAGGRIRALLIALAGLVVLGIVAARVPGRLTALLPSLLRGDRSLAVAAAGVAAAPVLILLYAAVGSPWPLVLTILGGAVALIALMFSR